MQRCATIFVLNFERSIGFLYHHTNQAMKNCTNRKCKEKNEKHGHEQQLQEKKLYRTLNNNPTGHTKTLSFHIFIWFWTSHQKILSYKKKHKVKNIKTWQLYKWTWQELWELWNLHSSRVWRSLYNSVRFES